MATKATLIDLCKNIIKDSTFTDTQLLAYLNQGQRTIAGGILLTYPDGTQALSSPLPLLITSGDITTSTSNPYVSLPSGYQRDLFMAVSANNDNRIDVYKSFPELLSMYPTMDNSGEVVAMAVRGTRIYYQGIPDTADTITLHYYSETTDMSASDSTPDALPEYLHEDLLVNFVCMKVFDMTETDRAEKVLTNHYRQQFNKAMLDLNASIETLPESIEFQADTF